MYVTVLGIVVWDYQEINIKWPAQIFVLGPLTKQKFMRLGRHAQSSSIYPYRTTFLPRRYFRIRITIFDFPTRLLIFHFLMHFVVSKAIQWVSEWNISSRQIALICWCCRFNIMATCLTVILTSFPYSYSSPLFETVLKSSLSVL